MKPELSIVLTTYGGETYHTQHCLGRIRRWKDERHELIVVCHDETPLLRAFLELCKRIGLVDVLVPAVPGHGHVRGVNLGFTHARAEVVFNVCIDMRIGAAVVDDCVARLRRDQRAGAIGWHYDWSTTFEGTAWAGDELRFALRKYDDSRVAGELDAEHVANVRRAPWFTGRVFDAIGTRRILCMNGSFFGVGKSLWERLGGFDERVYPNHWADDFFTYAVLDQGLDVANLPAPYRCGGRRDEFEALTDLEWQGTKDPYRGQDRIDWKLARPVAGLDEADTTLLELLDRTLDDDAPVAIAGDVPWAPTGGRRVTAPAAGNLAVLLADRASFEPSFVDRLAPGGVLVVFDAPSDERLRVAGRLGIHRREPARSAYVRAADRFLQQRGRANLIVPRATKP